MDKEAKQIFDSHEVKNRENSNFSSWDSKKILKLENREGKRKFKEDSPYFSKFAN